MDSKYKPTNLMFNTYDYKEWFTKEESDDKTLKCDEEEIADLLLLKLDEKVKEGKGIKVSTPSKL